MYPDDQKPKASPPISVESSCHTHQMASNPTPPKIREACENCHRRKIRCIIAQGNTACVNCVHNGTACLFAPRSKPGRPRRESREKRASQEAKEQGSHQSQNQSLRQKHNNSQRLPSPDYCPRRGDASLLNAPEMDPLDVESAWNMCWNTMDDLTSLHDPTASTFPPSTTAFSYADMTPGSFPKAHHIPPPNSWSSSSACFPLTPPSTLVLSPFGDVNENEDSGFDSTLQLCKKLDEYCQQVAHPAFMPSSDHEVFALVSRLCTAETSKGGASSHCPSAALTMAAILKVLELCGLVVAKLSRLTPPPPGSPPHVEHVFLLKKVDLLLLQTKVFLTQAGQQAGVQKALELHEHIESTIQKDYPSVTW